MSADDMLAADHVDVEHLLVEHRAACEELVRFRTDRTLLLEVVTQLWGWIQELDPHPGQPMEYLVLEVDRVPRTAELVAEAAR